MFDIGFFELLIIGVVGLVVIGPEKLPETLRTLALWWGRIKRGIASTRTELEQHIGADEIRRQLHNEDIMRQLRDTQQEVKSTFQLGSSDPTGASKEDPQPETPKTPSGDNKPS